MEEYYIGYVFDGLYPPEAAQWCNKNGTCHIEKNKDGKYEIVENIDQMCIRDRCYRGLRTGFLQYFFWRYPWCHQRCNKRG